MSSDAPSRKPTLHPANHWGPFAKDPWSPDLDPVVGEVWERACRAGRVGVDPTISPVLPRDAKAGRNGNEDGPS